MKKVDPKHSPKLLLYPVLLPQFVLDRFPILHLSKIEPDHFLHFPHLLRFAPPSSSQYIVLEPFYAPVVRFGSPKRDGGEILSEGGEM